jgi:hypothetical protein
MHRSTPYGVESRRIATVSSQGQQMGLTRGLTGVADRGSVNRAFVDNTTSSELTILQAPPVVGQGLSSLGNCNIRLVIDSTDLESCVSYVNH